MTYHVGREHHQLTGGLVNVLLGTLPLFLDPSTMHFAKGNIYISLIKFNKEGKREEGTNFSKALNE